MKVDGDEGLEKGNDSEVSVEEAFGSAFDEINGDVTAGDAEDDQTVATSNAEGDLDGDVGDENQNDADTGDDDKVVEAAEKAERHDDDEGLSEDEKQKKRSWQGRLRAEERRLKEQADALALKQEAIDKKTSPESDDIGDLDTGSEGGEAVGDDFQKEYPELSEALDDRINEKLKPIQQKDDAEKRAEAERHHDSLISEKHKGYVDTVNSQDFEDYISEQPSYAQEAIEAVLVRGTANQVIEMLDNYEKNSDVKSKREAILAKRKKQLKDAETVPSGPSKVPAGNKEAQDFDNAFDEAVAKTKTS